MIFQKENIKVIVAFYDSAEKHFQWKGRDVDLRFSVKLTQLCPIYNYK